MKRTLFFIIGIVLVLLACSWMLSVWKFIVSSEVGTGEVVGLKYGGSHPQIQFTTKQGVLIRYNQNGLIFGYKVGDRVLVYYKPSKPDDCTIKSFGALWGFPCMLLLLGFSFISITIFSKL